MDSFDELDDVQIAILLSLIANEHCLLTFDGPHCQALEDGIGFFVQNALGLQIVTVDMSEQQSLDDFASKIIIEGRPSDSAKLSSEEGYFSRRMEGSLHLAVPQLPNVIVLRHLESANSQLQAQVLDIMASRKLVTRKAVIPAPKRFIVIPLLYNKNLQKRPDLIAPLVDNIFLSHECTEFENDGESVRDADSLSSVIIRRPTPNTLTPSFNTQAPSGVLFSSEEIDRLAESAKNAFIHVDIKKYIADIVTFLRLHRAVAGGISPKATKQFELLARCLAPLWQIDYVTPTLVRLAAPKIYNHRIEIASIEEERSLQWGSTETAIKENLIGMDAQIVVEQVLRELDARAPI